MPPGAAPLIDAHVHVFARNQREVRDALAGRDPTFAEVYGDSAARMATGPELVTMLDRDGLDGAVAVGFAFSAPDDLEAQNEALAEAAATSAGRVAWLAAVNPARPGWRDEAERALDAGARGFGELRPLNQGWEPLGAAGRELCELALARNAVLLWHASEPVGHEYAGKRGGISPDDLIRVALACPGLAMVGAHLGAGAAFYLQMPEIRKAIDSLYFDTAAASLLYHPEAVARVIDLAGPGRVLFASDYPLQRPKPRWQALERLLSDESTRRMVGGANANSLFFSSRLASRTGVSCSGA
jgi:predicted TIM-barrel fold metal-dependent hydrolase